MLTVGLQKIFSLLESEDPNVRIHAVKVVANLAAEGAHVSFLKTLLLDIFRVCCLSFDVTNEM